MPALVFAQTMRLSGLRPNSTAAAMDGRIAAPVDKRAEDAAVAEIGQDRRHPGDVEGEEFGVGHFARRHGEFAMAAAGDVAGDRTL